MKTTLKYIIGWSPNTDQYSYLDGTDEGTGDIYSATVYDTKKEAKEERKLRNDFPDITEVYVNEDDEIIAE